MFYVSCSMDNDKFCSKNYMEESWGSVKINVLHFISSLHTGGAETLVKEYAQKIDKEKFHIEILCFNRLNSPYEAVLAEKGIKIYFLSDYKYYINKAEPNLMERAFNKFLRYILVRNYIKRKNPDIIHFHLNLANYVNFAKPNKGTVIFYTHHSSTQRLLSDDWYKGSIKNIKELLKGYRMQIVALHDEMKNDLCKIFDTNNISVLNNGVDRNRFSENLCKAEAKQRLGFIGNDIVIGHIGRFMALKNHTFLLKIFRQIKNRLPTAKLLLVGSGALRESILAESHALGLDKDVKIIENRLDIPEILRAMDCFVFPSISEGLPIVTIEAQFAKCPIVLSDVIDRRTTISNLIHYMSLQESDNRWAEVIVNLILDYDEQKVTYYEPDTWDINSIVKNLEKLYEKEYRFMHSRVLRERD